ncbi:DoxX family protein [Paraflavitalea soli]|uniref:DoxX family protein n=1 Tax=Paraflavitalea soli TaxID=2315862 RepID=A0A3B7MHJ9_9BACT|nr:BT_3928 family protein [Paraflavitalea soli]AXY73884.1 DoxX family protein [Paraflavitalea soli]
MKYFLTISRIIVGVLFIFSGLVKANDPLGLSYKMQEFFEIWGWGFLDNYTLAFSVAMNAFEIIAGVAILVGWQMRLFSWLLLLLIVFFTFLTGYALFSGKVRECGCFGDCIPLTADQSFMKDLLLLVLIGVIFIYRNKIKPAIPMPGSVVVLFFATVFSFAFQWFTLLHLPVVDCLPYKEGNNLTEKMKVPAGAIPDSTVITFVYNKAGKEIEFTAAQFPEDFDDSLYKFVKRYDKVVRKGNAEPKIKDFSLQTFYKNDTTQALLQEDKYQLYLLLRNDYNQGNWPVVLQTILQTATQKNIQGFLVTSIPTETLYSTESPAVFNMMLPLRCDPVVIKTAGRANPTLVLMKKGTILRKWSYADLDKALPVVMALEANKEVLAVRY